MDGEARANVDGKGDEPQDGTFVETFAVSPDGGKRGKDEGEGSVESRLAVDDEARSEPDVRSHERGKAENEGCCDRKVFAGHNASVARGRLMR